ncbi:MAG: hypothetical protein ABIP89_17395 [Polyangiaceae bacterium]
MSDLGWEGAVRSHGKLRQLGDGLWEVTGSLPWMPLPRNMVLHRLPDGGLLVHNAVALHEEAMREVESLGAPRVLVVPSRFHRLDAARYKERYPEMTVVAPVEARTKVAEKVVVDATAEEFLPTVGVRCHAPPGLRPLELAYEVPMGQGSGLLFNDALFNLDHLPGATGLILKAFGATGFFGMTLTDRLVFLRDRAQFQAWLREMARSKTLRAICVAHGNATLENANGALESAASRLD